jgi:hypothetical protein
VSDLVVKRAAACPHLADALGEAGAMLAQPQQELDPGQVGRGVAALAARRPADGADESGLLVVAEGVG